MRTLVSSGGGRIVADQLPQQLLAHAMRLAARRLGVGRATLYQKLTEYGRAGKEV